MAVTLVEGKRVVVCCGPGGVGKTSVSAAVALGLAATGARVVLVALDPTGRLAGTLGLEQLSNEPSRVSPERLASVETTVEGQLWAMTVERKQTFDDLVDGVIADPGRAHEIKSNRIYRELSCAIAGSQEFAAVARLFELERSGRFDVIVLDTPPSRSALDLLRAPGRLRAFLDSRALHAFKGRAGILGRGAARLLGVFGRLSGVELIADASTFFQLLGEITDEMGTRAVAADALLRASTTGFLLITVAEPAPVEETVWLARTLKDSALRTAGVVVNRMPGRSNLGELRRRFRPHDPILTVPDLRREVERIDDLWELHRHLFDLRGQPVLGRP
jgi:anion-transporting  ArsA/GET3 family ATPase